MTSPDIKRMAELERAMRREVEGLYTALLDAWNDRDAQAYARCFVEEGSIVGFDGSMVDGRDAIERHLSEIFGGHATPAYVSKILDVRYLAVNAVLLRAVAGMVPPGQADLNPALTAVQSLVAVYRQGPWVAAFFQNTPAQLHGRPQELERLNAELRQVLRRKPPPR
jgi:uncharacterized protein (TIGR02246 family)